jgi:hypothetical protein
MRPSELGLRLNATVNNRILRIQETCLEHCTQGGVGVNGPRVNGAAENSACSCLRNTASETLLRERADRWRPRRDVQRLHPVGGDEVATEARGRIHRVEATGAEAFGT